LRSGFFSARYLWKRLDNYAEKMAERSPMSDEQGAPDLGKSC
jgi:hypothetical protein